MQLLKSEVVVNIENRRKLGGNQTDIHKEIIERCKKGDRNAQYKLYELYSKAMFNICFRMMGNREEAEDILQEAFTEAFLQLETFRYESTFGAWLKKIVINRSINELKRKRPELEFIENIQYFDQKDNKHEDGNEDVKLSVKRIYNALTELADGYRVIFSLYMLEGYDHAEIAQILGIKESTSKSQFLRAKRKIKEILSGY